MKITNEIIKQFGGWFRFFRPFIESDEFDKIYRKLKEMSAAGKKIAPLSKDVFKAFRECDPKELKCIIAGICPYHTFDKTSGLPIADGIAISCSVTNRLQPSLENLYDAIENEYGNGVMLPNMIRNPNLDYLSHQGVLLYNVALTTEMDKACSMQDTWKEFNKYFWEEIISKYFKGLPIILLGQQSYASEQYIAPMLHYVYKLPHPASAAYSNTVWSSEGVFQKVNDIMNKNNGYWVEWFQDKKQEETRKQINDKKKENVWMMTEDDLPF